MVWVGWDGGGGKGLKHADGEVNGQGDKAPRVPAEVLQNLSLKTWEATGGLEQGKQDAFEKDSWGIWT